MRVRGTSGSHAVSDFWPSVSHFFRACSILRSECTCHTSDIVSWMLDNSGQVCDCFSAVATHCPGFLSFLLWPVTSGVRFLWLRLFSHAGLVISFMLCCSLTYSCHFLCCSFISLTCCPTSSSWLAFSINCSTIHRFWMRLLYNQIVILNSLDQVF